jgi:hypothetical protein
VLTRSSLASLALLALAACTGESETASSPSSTSSSTSSSSSTSGSSDTRAPSATLEAPLDGSIIAKPTVLVTGHAEDESRIARVEVNGVEADTKDGFATFTARVPLALGENTIVVLTRDELGNEDPAAARVDVTRKPEGDGTPPVIDEVFPPTFAGFEGPTVAVRVRASDASGIAAVRVGGIEAELDQAGDTWIARDVPVGPAVEIEAVDESGASTSAALPLEETTPFIASLSRLTAEVGGTVVGFEYSRQSLVRFDPFATPRAEILSGPTRGSGPPINTSLMGLDAIGDALYAAVAGPSNGVDVLRVDPVSGDRTVAHTCTFSSTPSSFVAAGAPLRFYFVTVSPPQLWRCSPGDATPTLVTDLPFTTPYPYVTEARHDAVNGRIVVPDGNYGQIVAVDLGDASASVLQPAASDVEEGIRGMTVVDGDVYFITYGNELRRITASQAAEPLTGVGYNYPYSMAPCSPDGSLSICVQSTGGSRMYRVTESAGVWTPTPVPFDNLVGSGETVGAADVVVVSDPDTLTPSLLFTGVSSGALHRLDTATGVRSLVGGSDLRLLSRMLPSGTVVGGGSYDASMFDARAPTIEITPVPGAAIPLVYRFDVLPAGTRLENEALVYVVSSPSSQSLRLRDLVSGDDVELAFVDDGVSAITTADDGTVYFGVFPGSGTTPRIQVLHPESSVPEPLADGLGEIPSLYFDASTRKLITGYHELVSIDVDTGEVTTLPPFHEPRVFAYQLRPGLFPGSVVSSSFFLENGIVLLDLESQSTFVLSR